MDRDGSLADARVYAVEIPLDNEADIPCRAITLSATPPPTRSTLRCGCAMRINPPPGVAPSYFQDRYVENELIGDFLRGRRLPA